MFTAGVMYGLIVPVETLVLQVVEKLLPITLRTTLMQGLIVLIETLS